MLCGGSEYLASIVPSHLHSCPLRACPDVGQANHRDCDGVPLGLGVARGCWLSTLPVLAVDPRSTAPSCSWLSTLPGTLGESPIVRWGALSPESPCSTCRPAQQHSAQLYR